MILTFLLPLFVWHESCLATDPLESCLATDPLVKVAAMGVPVIVLALLMPGIVVVAFLATMFSNSNSVRVLHPSRLVVTSVVVAMAALVSMVLFFVVVLPFFDTPYCGIVGMALATLVLVVAMAVPMAKIVVSVFVILLVVAPVVWSTMEPSIVAAATAVPVIVLSAMVVVGGVPTLALAMAAVEAVPTA